MGTRDNKSKHIIDGDKTDNILSGNNANGGSIWVVNPNGIIFGPRTARANYYADRNPPFFTIVNYEQVVSDSLDINTHLRPDVVVLDEAQRIKNWATKTAQAVKRLESRYAFVLTGTPLENRIDELYSLVDFLDRHR